MYVTQACKCRAEVVQTLISTIYCVSDLTINWCREIVIIIVGLCWLLILVAPVAEVLITLINFYWTVVAVEEKKIRLTF